ncbi:succinyldiaminopimelate transaminase [Sesbania bispinosa]|nr:succinyldiaminopimelate transaminase [Sesbania bispinosa]
MRATISQWCEAGINRCSTTLRSRPERLPHGLRDALFPVKRTVVQLADGGGSRGCATVGLLQLGSSSTTLGLYMQWQPENDTGSLFSLPLFWFDLGMMVTLDFA